MPIVILAWKSLVNRRYTVLLTVLSIALSVALLTGVERIRTETRTGFTNTLSGTDLIVGARSGAIQLLLYSVFRIGDPTNNISWQSYVELRDNPDVAWTVPLSLGDSHRGYRVLGTNQDYFRYYRYARDRTLQLAEGAVFSDLYDAVLGAEVAKTLGYRTGDSLIVAHGTGEVSFADHEDKPFRVAGILQPTGTPVDRTVHVSLEAIEAIHLGWQSGAPAGAGLSAEQTRNMTLTPEAISAALIGLDSRLAIFRVQRFINDYDQEPLTAILPGVALSQLWGLIGIAENALLVVSVFVVISGLFGMLTALLTGLNERRREMAILRSVGARPGHIFALIVGEAGALTAAGIVTGLGLLYSLLLIGRPLIETRFGIFIPLSGLSGYETLLIGLVLLAGIVVGMLPAYQAYRLSLADGLSMRV